MYINNINILLITKRYLQHLKSCIVPLKLQQSAALVHQWITGEDLKCTPAVLAANPRARRSHFLDFGFEFHFKNNVANLNLGRRTYLHCCV